MMLEAASPGDMILNRLSDKDKYLYVVIEHINYVDGEQEIIAFSLDRKRKVRLFLNIGNLCYWEKLA